MPKVSKEYAEAIFEIALTKGKNEEYYREISEVSKVFLENPLYLEMISTPALSKTEREELLKEAFEKVLSEDVFSFLMVLLSNGRIGVFEEVKEEYLLLLSEMKRVSKIEIYSASPLEKKEAERLILSLKEKFNREFEPSFFVDKSLIGGIKVIFEGKTYDNSLKAHLSELKEEILK